jgi:8-oxo-dGTP pyrophosphatase MutT (NUDIX family)
VHTDKKGILRFLLVQGHGDYWGFPKGHKEKGETHKETAERELMEETQITCDRYFGNITFTERYRIPKKRGSDIIKKVVYFIGLVSDTHVVRQTTELKNHGWFTLRESQEKLMKNRIKMLEEVSEVLK